MLVVSKQTVWSRYYCIAASVCSGCRPPFPQATNCRKRSRDFSIG